MPPHPHPRRSTRPADTDDDSEMRHVDRELRLILAHADRDARFLRAPVIVLRARTAVRRRYLQLQADGMPLATPYGVAAAGVFGLLIVFAAAAAFAIEQLAAPPAEATAAEPPMQLADQPAERTLEPRYVPPARPTGPIRDNQPQISSPAAHPRPDTTVDISVVASLRDGRFATRIVAPGVLELSVGADTDLNAAVSQLLNVVDNYRPRHTAAPPVTVSATLLLLGLDVLDMEGPK